MQRSTIILFLVVLTVQPATAQSVTGAWFGRADVMMSGINNNYLTELIIKQKGNEVEGIFGYYFKDSYQSFFIRGTYNKTTRQVNIKNLPVLFYRSNTRNGIECPMNFEGTLRVSQVSSNLTGTFISEEKYKYTCPQLRVNFSLDKSDNSQENLANTVAQQKFWQPQEEDFIVTKVADNKTVTLSGDVTKSDAENIIESPGEQPTNELIARFAQRKKILMETLEVEGDSIRVSFYDNGDIDGDSISILLNNQPVLINQELTARALNVYLALDKGIDLNEISMFAENLGKFPPNTALMVVSDGKNRYEVYLSSSYTQNATVRIRRKK